MLLNKFFFRTDYKMISDINYLPQLFVSEENRKPRSYLTETKLDPLIPAIIIYFSTSLPIQPYSQENIELLKSLGSCSNLRIYEHILIQKIIDFNWNSVSNWINFYS